MPVEGGARFPGYLVVGLGNPGIQYAHTRHNMGFQVVDRLAARVGVRGWAEAALAHVAEAAIEGRPVVLAKPQTYMNRSGASVARLVERHRVPLERLIVVHDDLDLPFGVLRIRTRGGHGGHNGLRSILQALGAGEFLRVKVGIGRPAGKGDVVDYVLGPFAPDEAAELPAVVERAADAVTHIVLEGPIKAMNRFHS